MQPRRRNGPQRRGAAVAEMAIVTPLLVLIIAGVIEFGWVFAIRQDLTTITRDCARVAMLRNVSAADVRARLKAQLDRRGLSNLAGPGEAVSYDPDTGVTNVLIKADYREIMLWPWADILGLRLHVTVNSSTPQEAG